MNAIVMFIAGFLAAGIIFMLYQAEAAEDEANDVEALALELVQFDLDRSEARIAHGRKLHKAFCAVCHSDDGRASMAMTFKGVWGTELEQAEGSARLYNREFFAESVTFPAATITKGYTNSMPPFALQPAEVRALAEYVRSLGSPEHAAKSDQPVSRASHARALRRVYLFCNDINEMRDFYGSVLHLNAIDAFESEDDSWITYCAGEIELWIFKAKDELPVRTEWAWQPGETVVGAVPGTSFSLQLQWSEFKSKPVILPFLNVKTQTPKPTWRQNSYWGWTVADPMGNTIEIFATPPQKPAEESPKWQD
jgi:mono/diheme cytochrome c family protein